MILFNVITCIVCIALMLAFALILEDRIRWVRRVSMTAMSAAMIMSTWATVAGISRTDGWVFVVFRCGFVVYIFSAHWEPFRIEVIRRLSRVDDEPRTIQSVLAAIFHGPPPTYDELRRQTRRPL